MPDLTSTDYYLDLDGNLPNGSIPTFTNSRIENVNIVRLSDMYAMIIYTELDTSIIKALIIQRNKRLYNIGEPFVVSPYLVDEIASCRYDDNSVLLTCSYAKDHEIKLQVLILKVIGELVEGTNVKSLIIQVQEQQCSITTNHITNLQIQKFDDRYGIVAYSDEQNSGYGIIRKYSIGSSAIIIDSPIIFNETYTSNTKLLPTINGRIGLVYQQNYLGCKLMTTFVSLNEDAINISEKYVFDSFNSIGPIDAIVVGNKIHIVYRNFHDNVIKVLEIDVSLIEITPTYMTINEPDVEDISIVDIENNSIVIIYNTVDSHTNVVCIKEGIVKSKLQFNNYCGMNRLILLNTTHITYIGDNTIQNIGVNKYKYEIPNTPTYTAEQTTSVSVIINSDPGAKIRLFIQNGTEEQNVVENGAVVTDKYTGEPWIWLNNDITYHAYAFMDDDDNGYRSDNSGAIDVTLDIDVDNSQNKVTIYGLMEDGSRKKVNLSDIEIECPHNNDIISVGIGANHGQILLIRDGETMVTITEKNLNKKTYLMIKVVSG